jgi:maleate cis-trans isomerase
MIVPSVNAVIEPEFYRLAPPGFAFHATRVMLRETTPDGLREMNREVDHAAALLATVKPDVLVYACTGGSFVDGWEALQAQIANLAGIAGCPAVATSAAMVAALEHVGARRIALATPYLDAVNAIEQGFLEARGFTVVACRGLGLSGQAIREVPPERARALALATDTPDAEALFLSCTDLRALEMVDELEGALRKPVLTSNQVTLWALLRAAGWRGTVPGSGRLLSPVA